jgi:Ca2+/Na+ antiporter
MAILAFIFGVVVLTYSSGKAVEHSLTIAYACRISLILIGLLLVSVGTDLPEIINSVFS